MAFYISNYNCWISHNELWREGVVVDLDPYDALGLNIVYRGLLSPWEETPEALAQRFELPMPQEGSFMYQAARACVHRLVQPQAPITIADHQARFQGAPRSYGVPVGWTAVRRH